MLSTTDLIMLCIVLICSSPLLFFLLTKTLIKKDAREKGNSNPENHTNYPSCPMPTCSKIIDNREISEKTDYAIERRENNGSYPIPSPLIVPNQTANENNTERENNSYDGKYYKQYPLVRFCKSFNLVPKDKGNCSDNNQKQKLKKGYYIIQCHIKRIIKRLWRVVNQNGTLPRSKPVVAMCVMAT